MIAAARRTLIGAGATALLLLTGCESTQLPAARAGDPGPVTVSAEVAPVDQPQIDASMLKPSTSGLATSSTSRSWAMGAPARP